MPNTWAKDSVGAAKVKLLRFIAAKIYLFWSQVSTDDSLWTNVGWQGTR